MQGAAPLTVIRAGTLNRRAERIAEEESAHLRARGRIEKVADDPAAIPAGAKVINLSNATVLPGLIDAHTHIFRGARTRRRRLRRKHSEGRNRAAKRRGHLCGAESTRARIRRASRSGDRGAGYATLNQAGDRRGNNPWAENFWCNAGDIDDGRYKPGRVCAGTEMPKGVQIVDGPVERGRAASNNWSTARTG